MKKIILFLTIALGFALVSCDVAATRANLKGFVVNNERTKLPLIKQNYAIISPEVIDISIDSVTFYYSKNQLFPTNGYFTTKWKIKRNNSYSEYSFLRDEYADYDEKTYLIEISDMYDFSIDGSSVKYTAKWPESNPFKN